MARRSSTSRSATSSVGDLGFPVFDGFGGKVGMLICNDRRWPEAYRVLGLQGVELICIGYNTPVHNPPAPEHDRFGDFHNHLVMQAGAYQNGTFVVGVAKAGAEEGIDHIGGSCVIHPSGTIVAQCTTLGDEVVVAACDLDDTVSYKTTVFDLRPPPPARPVPRPHRRLTAHRRFSQLIWSLGDRSVRKSSGGAGWAADDRLEVGGVGDALGGEQQDGGLGGIGSASRCVARHRQPGRAERRRRRSRRRRARRRPAPGWPRRQRSSSIGHEGVERRR